MAAIHQYVVFRDTVHPSDLCPRCFKPSLRLHQLQKMDLDGITPIGTRIYCRDEKVWITELKEFVPNDTADH